MAALTAPNIEPDEIVTLDSSTAPTTPEGSLTFSPVLRPLVNIDGLDDDVMGTQPTRRPLSSTLLSATRTSGGPIRNICCVGAGYVGGPTAAVMAFQNPHIRVCVVDKDPTRIRRWNSRHPPIYEPGLTDILRISRDGSKEFQFANDRTRAGASDLESSTSSQSTSSSECGSQCGEHLEPTTSVSARQPNLFFSTDVSRCISEADIVLIAVNTPTKMRGAGAGRATDLTSFEAVTAEVAQHARPGAVIVEKSTVPCRTARFVQETIAIHRPGVHFEILSNPEFLAAGTAVNDLLHPDRVLIGSSPTASGRRAAEALALVYAAWVPRDRIITTNVWSSELSKLVANSMLAQRISSINSVAAICEKTGANVDEVAASIGCDPRIGDKFLKAGIGFGGSCFKKDILSLVYLAESLGLDEVAEYWSQVVKINEYSRERFTRRVVKCLNNTLVGKKITILGYAFKKNTSDTRESPAQEIIRTLLEERPKEVAVFDPCCNPTVIQEEIEKLLIEEEKGPVHVYSSAYEACANSDAILITTEFDEFRNRATTQRNFTPLAQAAKRNTSDAARVAVDPRPFERLEPSETDLLALHKFLTTSTTSDEPSIDPLQRFNPEPSCQSDCPDCVMEGKGYRLNEEHKTKERLDWAKISYHMRKPRWVFDGRGVLDIKGMTKLGLRVESVGRSWI